MQTQVVLQVLQDKGTCYWQNEHIQVHVYIMNITADVNVCVYSLHVCMKKQLTKSVLYPHLIHIDKHHNLHLKYSDQLSSIVYLLYNVLCLS